MNNSSRWRKQLKIQFFHNNSSRVLCGANIYAGYNNNETHVFTQASKSAPAMKRRNNNNSSKRQKAIAFDPILVESRSGENLGGGCDFFQLQSHFSDESSIRASRMHRSASRDGSLSLVLFVITSFSFFFCLLCLRIQQTKENLASPKANLKKTEEKKRERKKKKKST